MGQSAALPEEDGACARLDDARSTTTAALVTTSDRMTVLFARDKAELRCEAQYTTHDETLLPLTWTTW
jgi:hypothetical protein